MITLGALAGGLLLISGWAGGDPSASPPPRDYRFDRTISREVLENYLSRSISMEGLLNGRGDLADNIRMLRQTGAKFIGRSLCLWGGEASLLQNLERARQQATQVHAADPDMVLQACIFEIVTTQVEQVPVPDWAFRALGMPVEERHFRFADMLYPNGRFKDHWRAGNSVPDVSRPETKLRYEITWFAHQSRESRAAWLRYAWDWVRRTDPNGFLQMPGSRTLRSPLDDLRWYHANNAGPAVPNGFGDEAGIGGLGGGCRGHRSLAVTSKRLCRDTAPEPEVSFSPGARVVLDQPQQVPSRRESWVSPRRSLGFLACCG